MESELLFGLLSSDESGEAFDTGEGLELKLVCKFCLSAEVSCLCSMGPIDGETMVVRSLYLYSRCDG